LAFLERTARVKTGVPSSAGQFTSKLDVPKKAKTLTMATLSICAGDSTDVTVIHAESESVQGAAGGEPTQPSFQFDVGARVGMGNFLSSLIGAPIQVDYANGCVSGLLMLVEESQRLVPGSEWSRLASVTCSC
jgi:hypothetical protein